MLHAQDMGESSTTEQVEALYKGTDALSQFAQEVMIPALKGQFSFTDKESALVGIYYRMCLARQFWQSH